MNDPNYDHSEIPVAAIVNPSQKKMSSGRLIAIILSTVLGLGFLLLGAAAIYVWYDLTNPVPTTGAKIATETELRSEIEQGISDFKTAMLNPTVATDHPQYDRIMDFVEKISATLDDTPNPRLQKFIDYDRFLDELIRRSSMVTNSRILRPAYLVDLKDNVIGPTSFSHFEIIRIENDGPNLYRIYLTYSAGYQNPEPHVWWVSDDERRIRLYDWLQIELGIRATSESAIVGSAGESESDSYDEYVASCYEYLESDETDESYQVRKKRVHRILSRCERFRGPALLRPSIDLITARRWDHEGESDRALELMKKIKTPELAPGVYLLKGAIEMERGQYEAALASYRKSEELIGPAPLIRTQLAKCYRELNEPGPERKILNSATSFVSASDLQNLRNLVELNDPTQNSELFARIDQATNRDEIYYYLMRGLSDSAFYADDYSQLVKHLEANFSQSKAAILGSIRSDSKTEVLKKGLKWIDENVDDEDSEGIRYNFWYQINEQHIPSVLESSAKKIENFESLTEVSEYEGMYSNDVMRQACEVILKTNPDNHLAHYQLGQIQSLQGDLELAKTSLNDSFRLMPKDSEFQDMIRYELLNIFFKTGDHDSAVDLAIEHDLLEELFVLKNTEEDFSEFERLLKLSESDSEQVKFQQALWANHKGDHEQAILELAELANSEDEENAFGYELYSYRNKLVDICQQQNDITRAAKLVPNSSMFSLVSRRLVDEFDWANCEKLLKIKNRSLSLEQLQFQQLINFEQGNYQRVVDNADQVLDRAKRDDLSVELEQLVRSALRINQLDLATRFAESAESLTGNYELAALVAFHRKQWKQAMDRFHRLSSYEKTEFYGDVDMHKIDLSEVPGSDQFPPRSLLYYFSGQHQLESDLLFETPLKIDRELLRRVFTRGQIEPAEIKKVQQPKGFDETWSVKTQLSHIFISQRLLDFEKIDEPEHVEDEILKEAIKRSKNHVRIVALKNEITTEQTDYEILLAAIRKLASPDLQAFSNGYRWRIAKELSQHVDRLEGKQPSEHVPRLFSEGEYYYMGEPDEDGNDDAGDKSFTVELVDALKRYQQSDDPDKKMVVRVDLENGVPIPLVTTLEYVRRSGYGSVSLVAVVNQNATTDSTIRAGQKVEVSLHQIVGFELSNSGEEIIRDRDALEVKRETD